MLKNSQQLIILIGGLLILVLPLIYFMQKNRRDMQKYYETLERLSGHFSGQLSRSNKFYNDVPSFVGQFSSYKFTLTYFRVESAPPRSLQLKCYAKSKGRLKIFSYAEPHTVFFAKRVVIDDAQFDKYYIYSNMPEEAEDYINNTLRKTVIKKLVEDGWSFPMMTRNSIAYVLKSIILLRLKRFEQRWGI